MRKTIRLRLSLRSKVISSTCAENGAVEWENGSPDLEIRTPVFICAVFGAHAHLIRNENSIPYHSRESFHQLASPAARLCKLTK